MTHQPLHGVSSFINLLQNTDAFAVKYLAFRGQSNVSRITFQQPHAEGLFQLTDDFTD